MAEKHNIFHGQFVYAESHVMKLLPSTAAGVEKYKQFLATLTEGQKVEIFMESDVDNGTLPQLAKVHVCIRELAKELGYSFEDMKLEVKRQAGLCIKKELGGEVFMICKSFADCSKEELSLAMEAIIQIGETVGINFR